jgi:hypothetical protein
MSPLVYRPIFNKLLIVVSCSLAVCASTRSALAQHPAGRTGGVLHMPAPPVPHVPISSAPMIHAPIIYAPISTPRISITPSGGGPGTAVFLPPRRPIRRFPPVLVVYESPFLFGGPFWGMNSCGAATCDLFWFWTLGSTTVSSPGPTNYISQVNETPVYVYGEERPDLPQLFLKDGTILSVTDYWVVDNQLHFTMIEENGAKPSEHVIPFDTLDLQTTVDANTRRGFRFMLRNEPFQQYLRDHPEGPPPTVTPPRG